MIGRQQNLNLKSVHLETGGFSSLSLNEMIHLPPLWRGPSLMTFYNWWMGSMLLERQLLPGRKLLSSIHQKLIVHPGLYD